MSAKDHTSIILKDPLSDLSRKERRSLLATAAVGLVIVEADVLPSKISALGIEFDSTNQAVLLIAIACVIGYFLSAFAIYAWSDFLAWRLSITESALEAIRDFSRPRVNDLVHADRAVVPRSEKESKVLEDQFVEHIGYLGRWNRLSKPTAIVRGCFEFLLPIVFGIVAIVEILRRYHQF